MMTQVNFDSIGGGGGTPTFTYLGSGFHNVNQVFTFDADYDYVYAFMQVSVDYFKPTGTYYLLLNNNPLPLDFNSGVVTGKGTFASATGDIGYGIFSDIKQGDTLKWNSGYTITVFIGVNIS